MIRPLHPSGDRSLAIDRRRGTAAVEAALVLPVMAALFLAGVDYCRAMHAQMALASAARAGAEYAARHGVSTSTRTAWESRIRSAVADEAASIPAFQADRLTLEISTQGVSHEDLQIAVTAVYSFSTIIRWPGVPQQLLLRRVSGMHQYR